jgi:hypothetical protein
MVKKNHVRSRSFSTIMRFFFAGNHDELMVDKTYELMNLLLLNLNK